MQTLFVNDNAITPSKVVCIGRNYADHIAELNNEVPSEPVIFVKPNSAIATELRAGNEQGDGEAIHYEGEISFLVTDGKLSAVGFGLDLTKRAVQSRLKAKGLPWERAKSFDGAAVFSGFAAFDGDSSELSLELYINDTLIQEGGYPLMLHKPEALLDEVQRFMSFENGDVLMTGTPAGVGIVDRGDVFHGKILRQGKLIVEARWTAA